jgi:4-hydroxybenzoate polyprenyltransferase
MRSILRLVRLPNVFTAMADIMMGFLFVHGDLQPASAFACLMLASSALYMAGMVLNDWFDVEVDRRLRPERPIPAGEVTLRLAGALGFGLLLLGLVMALAVVPLSTADASLRWRPALVAALLAVAILLYDGALKRTPVAPLLMGACRSLNILLGMSLVAGAANLAPSAMPLGYNASQWAVALGLGTYVAGITWFARHEARASGRAHLVWGMIVMILGLAVLASFPRFGPFATGQRQLTFRLAALWPLAVALLGVSTLRRCFVASIERSPRAIQTAVKQSILSLIVFDAAVTMAVCPGWWYAVAVLALMVPFLTLGRWIEST